jgi:hypothetical protein
MTKFDSLLARVPRSLEPFGYKQAGPSGIESPDENQLEQDFSRLAYMFVQDRAAPLMKYMLGFEVVNREEDGSRAVGLFGFKIGKDYYYVPAFFVNNQIKGVDLLFSKRTNMFLPLQEDWINYIVNRQTIELGGQAEDKVQRDFERPNFGFLARPPIGPKTAEAESDSSLILAELARRRAKAKGKIVKLTRGDVTDEEYEDAKKKVAEAEQPWSFKEAWYQLQMQLNEKLEKDAAFQEAWGGLVCSIMKKDLPFEKTGEASPLKTWLEERGGPQAVSVFLNTLTRNHKYANAALTFYPSVESLYVHQFAPELMRKSAAQIRVTTQVTDYVDGEAKKRLVRDGFTIVDTRPEASKSEAYDIDYERRFSNPDASGTYQVLLKDGRTTKAWVFMPSNAAKNGAAVVVEQDKLMYRMAEPGAVYVRDTATGDTTDAYSKAVAIDDMELNTEYVLIDDKGHSTGPVEVRAIIAEDDKRTKLRVNWRGTYDIVKRPTYGRDFDTLHGRRYQGECCGNSDMDYIELADHKGSISRSGTDTLILPSNWKALKLYDKNKGDRLDSYESERILRDAFQLGTLVDVTEAMTKNSFHKLTVASDDQGLEYYFRVNDNFATRPMGYKQAYVSLVTRFGLGVPDAETMLTEAASQFKCRRLVKVAQMPSGPMVGVDMPQPNDPSAQIDPYTGMPMYQMPYEQQMTGSMTGMPPTPDGNQFGINIGGEAEMDSGAQDLAAQAGQLGQKHIFDHASIGGLAKVYDTGAVLDSYVPELMQSLDRLGRILFLYYWKNEDFAERYGSNDIVEMEDLIRSVFKSFGELVLQLRKKAIDKDDSNTVEM